MFLYKNGYRIIDEHLVREEHRLYEIIVCKYEGLDPERSGDGTLTQYPQNRICSIGVDVEF